MTLMHADVLTEMADEFKNIEEIEKAEALEFARKNNIPVREKFKDGRIKELQKIKNNIPYYYTTHNEYAAISTRTNHLWSSPFSVTGLGYTNLGEWDGGAVLSTHDELIGRVTQVDVPTVISDHATHVAGTLIASGQNPLAKGMAYESTLLAYDWNSDESEMATAAANGMEVSNHSYGFVLGWDGDSNWYGDISIDQNEVYNFGFYSSDSRDWDNIAYNAPYYLIVKSAGNDRNDDAPIAGTPHTHNSGTEFYTDTHYSDGFDNGGYDTISEKGIAKNILTIGAVDDVPTYLSSSDVVMSTFSSWGPADDGRIKPDIVGNGVGLTSSIATSASSYDSYNGTSMSSPNVTGTLALLQQSYKLTHSDTPMRSATLKALVIHTADEAGDFTGPDYSYGWGLLNAKKAAETITEDSSSNVIDELSLANGASYVRDVVLPSDDASLKVTIVWTDPAGTPVAPALDPTDKMLVNDLNLKITKDGVTYYPWKLDKSNPSNAATNTGVNDVDNVEQVYIANPTAGTYTITVDHAGTLASNQNFSIVLSYSQEVQINTVISEDFNNALFPSNWTIVDNIPSSVTWGLNTDLNVNLLGNYTGGTGTCAGANSDGQGTAAYDTELITPALNLSSYGTVSLSFSANYQSFDSTDKFDVDVSADGGSTWTNVLSWNTNHGAQFATPGESVLLDITSIASGKSDVLVRFHYYNPSATAWDWYVEIDDVVINGQKNTFLPPAIIMYLLN